MGQCAYAALAARVKAQTWKGVKVIGLVVQLFKALDRGNPMIESVSRLSVNTWIWHRKKQGIMYHCHGATRCILIHSNVKFC